MAKVKANPARESISKADYIYAVNEWWRRYRDEPATFQAQFQVIIELNTAEAEGREPTVGENDFAYMCLLLDERDAARKSRGVKPRPKAPRPRSTRGR